MFQKPQALNSETHRDLRFKPVSGFAFAAKLVVIPVFFAELAQISRHMPMVFPLNTSLPLALVSADGHSNAHVHANGQWQGAGYVPASLRSYPFMLQEIRQANNDAAKVLAVFFDQAAAHFQSQQGERLLDDAGQPSVLLKSIQGMLSAQHSDRQRTHAMVAQLDSLGVLRTDNLKITPPKGNPIEFKGFRVVDREAFAALEPEQLKALQASGALTLVYAHLLSLSHLEDGWLSQQTLHAAASSPAAQASASAPLFDFDSIDWSKYGKT